MIKVIFLFASVFLSNLAISQDKAPHTPTSITEEMRVKREEIFEFIKKPIIVKEDNQFRISFESKAFCDVTVAIENQNGKIIRHLASGVLGLKAPAPFQKNSKAQIIIWDAFIFTCSHSKGLTTDHLVDLENAIKTTIEMATSAHSGDGVSFLPQEHTIKIKISNPIKRYF